MSLKKFLENKNLIINTLFINEILKLNLDIKEFLILIYFDNLVNKEFNITQLVEFLGINENDALVSFNKLIEKKVITVTAEKNSLGKIVEKVSLDGFYSLVADDFNNAEKQLKKTDIFTEFEKQFGRPLSSMEYEIINAWLDKSYSEELILGALKEAVYSGVTNLRYIDKILYEWQRKGFKTMQDVDNHMVNRNKKKDIQKEELFEYDWLDED